MQRKAVFITIGQTPRTDLVPELAAWIGDRVEIVERGALDGLEPAAIAAQYPQADEHRLVTRLADGSEVVVRKAWIRQRLQGLLGELRGQDYFLTVLLCTGRFGGLTASGLLIEAQTVVDHGVAALAAGAPTLGVLLPLAEQIEEFHYRPSPGQRVLYSHASPYGREPSERRLAAAASELAAAELIVMHCMGYTESMRRTVAEVSGRPVLLARRMLAGAVQQLL